ncbi:hypothetical protein QQ045_032491 [Rhodiola kirilowii]
MERRMNKYRQTSPERAKVWTEKSPKYVQYRKVSVLYYLNRNGQLEQPHFIDVKISSPRGLYLREFMNRLNALRGRSMASRYSWSCKRSYKTGFVWHDLSVDDLIHPTTGSEYVLKGSELIEESSSGEIISGKDIKYQNLRQLPEPTPCRSRDGSSTSSIMNGKQKHLSLKDAYSPLQHPVSRSVSHEYRVGKCASPAGHLRSVEYKLGISEKTVDVSTQTGENPIPELPQDTCTRGVSAEDVSSTPILEPTPRNKIPLVQKNSVLSRTSESPHHCSGESSSAEKIESLASLIRADAIKKNSIRILEEENISKSPNTLKAMNMIMHLISCGSISEKDHSSGIFPAYKPRFSSSKFPSPVYSSSVLLGELDCMSAKPRDMGLKMEEKEYFSGGLIETKMLREIGVSAALKRSSSFDADRTIKLSNADEADGRGLKCIPMSIKASLSKHPRSESMRSPFSASQRTSTEVYRSQTLTPRVSVANSKRISNPSDTDKKAP